MSESADLDAETWLYTVGRDPITGAISVWLDGPNPMTLSPQGAVMLAKRLCELAGADRTEIEL